MKLLLLVPIFLLLAWCSNFDSMTDQRIKELEEDKQKAQIACDQVQVMQKKIDGLLSYKGNNTPKEEKTAEIKEEPTVATTLWYICLVWNQWATEYREYQENEMTYLEVCGAFYNVKWCYIAPDSTNCLKKE